MKTTGYHKAEDWMNRIACQPESSVRRGEILDRESLTVLRDRPTGHHPRDIDLNQTSGVVRPVSNRVMLWGQRAGEPRSPIYPKNEDLNQTAVVGHLAIDHPQ